MISILTLCRKVKNKGTGQEYLPSSYQTVLQKTPKFENVVNCVKKLKMFHDFGTFDLWPTHVQRAISLLQSNRLWWMRCCWKGKHMGFPLIWNFSRNNKINNISKLTFFRSSLSCELCCFWSAHQFLFFMILCIRPKKVFDWRNLTDPT